MGVAHARAQYFVVLRGSVQAGAMTSTSAPGMLVILTPASPVVPDSPTPSRLAVAADQGADLLAAQDAHQIALAGHVVDAQRNLVVAAQRDRAGVHHLQVALD